jgi:hypothetical protein
MTGIRNVAGTRVVAFATDVTTTLRKAFTLMQTNREPPNAVVLYPADAESGSQSLGSKRGLACALVDVR